MIVDKLTKLEDKVKRFNLDEHEYTARLISAEDERVAYVKLADRLHNMRTINGHSNLSKQQKIAQETMDLFVPIAQQLDLTDVTNELNKLSLEVLKQ